MKTLFLASLCYKGILGGSLIVDDEGIGYHSNKLTIPEKYRRLRMPFNDIYKITLSRMFLLPAIAIDLDNGETHKFIVFNRKRLVKVLTQLGQETKIV